MGNRWQQTMQGRGRSRAALLLALGYLLLFVPLLLHHHAGRVDSEQNAPVASAQIAGVPSADLPAPASDDCFLCDLLAFGLLAASPALLVLPFRRWRVAFFAHSPRPAPWMRGRSRSPRAPPAFS